MLYQLRPLGQTQQAQLIEITRGKTAQNTTQQIIYKIIIFFLIHKNVTLGTKEAFKNVIFY
ncbi:hypothetical protein DO021_10515 [Desulfobacter hydrogenophilus]|uniref:Uncharacterized protein n=1 Tax=Desulfobacter hydrogenophilus TaxID=2291 RepID=A0A328FBM4_9BACT|nr:hypothetical protein DO021_10515 [Desulfobacter hydrogenophilus]